MTKIFIKTHGDTVVEVRSTDPNVKVVVIDVLETIRSGREMLDEAAACEEAEKAFEVWP